MLDYFSPAAFWAFSVEAYSAEGVSACCLAWQDEHGVNINLLLLLWYASRSGYVFDEAIIGQLHATAREWDVALLDNYRALRRCAKSRVSDEAYRAIKVAELALEKDQQRHLLAKITSAVADIESSVASPVVFNAALVTNLQVYLSLFGEQPNSLGQHATAQIILTISQFDEQL